MNKINVIIPARGGSKGIPRKNLVLLGGRPLLAHTIEFCLKIDCFGKVYVSSEDEEIKEVSGQYGVSIIDRPKEYSQDNSSDYGFLKHFFDVVGCEEVVLMRPTSPFRSRGFVSEAIEEYLRFKKDITGFRSVSLSSTNPYKACKIENNICKGFFDDYDGEKDYMNLPRQIFPVPWVGNGHIDIVKKETVDKGSVFGDNVFGKLDKIIIDIDTIEDFEYAEYLIKTGKVVV